jgi:hypothetical protein
VSGHLESLCGRGSVATKLDRSASVRTRPSNPGLPRHSIGPRDSVHRMKQVSAMSCTLMCSDWNPTQSSAARANRVYEAPVPCCDRLG